MSLKQIVQIYPVWPLLMAFALGLIVMCYLVFRVARRTPRRPWLYVQLYALVGVATSLLSIENGFSRTWLRVIVVFLFWTLIGIAGEIGNRLGTQAGPTQVRPTPTPNDDTVWPPPPSGTVNVRGTNDGGGP